jgi:hypothetical protein
LEVSILQERLLCVAEKAIYYAIQLFRFISTKAQGILLDHTIFILLGSNPVLHTWYCGNLLTEVIVTDKRWISL